MKKTTTTYSFKILTAAAGLLVSAASANVGITNGTLYVSSNTSGYKPESTAGTFLDDAFKDETTYLLAMKRTNAGIFASLIEVDGEPNTITSEPTWQVSHTGSSGVTLVDMRFIMAGTSNTGFQADELRIGTSWASVTEDLQMVPEPATYALILSALCFGFVLSRRRKLR